MHPNLWNKLNLLIYLNYRDQRDRSMCASCKLFLFILLFQRTSEVWFEPTGSHRTYCKHSMPLPFHKFPCQCRTSLSSFTNSASSPTSPPHLIQIILCIKLLTVLISKCQADLFMPSGKTMWLECSGWWSEVAKMAVRPTLGRRVPSSIPTNPPELWPWASHIFKSQPVSYVYRCNP